MIYKKGNGEIMAIVKTIKSGGATIYACDDDCKNKTDEEVAANLAESARIASIHLNIAQKNTRKKKETTA